MQEVSFAQLHLFPMYCLVWNENYLLTWLHPVLKVNNTKQLLDEVEHDIMNYQNWGLCYLPKPKAEADDTDTRFW